MNAMILNFEIFQCARTWITKDVARDQNGTIGCFVASVGHQEQINQHHMMTLILGNKKMTDELDLYII